MIDICAAEKKPIRILTEAPASGGGGQLSVGFNG